MPKAQKKTTGSYVRTILILIAVIGFAALLYTNQETLKETWQVLINANIKYVLILPLIQIVNYGLVGEYYRRMFGIFGSTISRPRAWGIVAAMNFVNQILPSGGISGISYLAYGFRATVDIGKTTLIQFGRYIYAFMAYSVLGPVALLVLLLQDQTSEFSGVIEEATNNTAVIIVMIAFICIVVGTFVFLVRADLSHKTGRTLQKGVSWVKQHIFRKDSPVELTFLRNLHREFRDGIQFLTSQGKAAVVPFFFMLLSALCELLIVYASLLAVGIHISIGVVFIAFVAANMVGVISIIPGDVGVHEATMLIVLTAFGVPEPATLSAILLYRVFNKVIFLPIGFYFYSNILKPAEKAQ